jgi:hypothetical protein
VSDLGAHYRALGADTMGDAVLRLAAAAFFYTMAGDVEAAGVVNDSLELLAPVAASQRDLAEVEAHARAIGRERA